MHQGKLVFAQLMLYLPLSTFRRCVTDHRGEHKVKDFSCLDQFFAMAFAQLTYRESLRDIEVNLRAQARRLYHMHQYTANNTAAFVAWILFFVLVLFFELMVVLSKLVFGETVDDELDQIREQISQQKARAYIEAVTSPVANARQLLESSYS